MFKFNKNMKNIIILTLFMISYISYSQEEITLQQCYSLSLEHSPILKKKNLVSKSTDISYKSLNTGYYPTLELNAQATYQSDVIELPFKLPNIQIDGIPQDQYKATLDLKFPIYDGSIISNQKDIYKSAAAVELQKIDVDYFKIKEQINTIYLNILLLEENIKIIENMSKDIETNIDKIEAMLLNGVGIKKNLIALEAELIKTNQKIIELKENRSTAIRSLSIIIGRNISENTKFIKPQIEFNNLSESNNRPEYKLFELQKSNIESQSQMLSSKNLPKLFFFATGGYGKPALNMLKSEAEDYYIFGLKLNMPLTNWWSTQYDDQVLEIQKSIVDNQKDIFTMNNELQQNQYISEIEKYTKIIQSDLDVIKKRQEIKVISESQLQNGIITSNDFLIDLNATFQAELNHSLHQIQLLQSKINYQATLGN